MSDAPSTTHDDGPHEGPIKTPKQLILAVVYSFLVPIIGIVLLTVYVGNNSRPNAGSNALTPEAIAARIHPVGTVEIKDPTDTAAMKTGEQVFAAQCTACHTAGVAGAPKFGDAAAWGPRIATGYEALLHSALKGKGAMGAQGGGDFSDLEIGRAVVYMANKGGAKFDEPKAPAAGAAVADAASAAPAAAAPVAVAAASAAAPEAPTAVAAATPATPVAAAAGGVPALYAQVCQVCHTAGLAGAPKLGDKAAWAPRIAEAKDIDGLTAIAIKGKNAMPPKGGAMTASDADIKAVVTYMVSQVK
ncbi:c-type cytochrome [soil metagenome]